MSHKFSIGQTVIFTPETSEIHTPTRGKITRLLPIDGTDYQYHIQAESDGLVRLVRESQIRAV
jgi:hypothetical protein